MENDSKKLKLTPSNSTLKTLYYKKYSHYGTESEDMKIISGSSNRPLAEAISKRMKIDIVDADISHFANGEKRVWVKEDVRGQNIILVQSFSQPVDEYIIESLMFTDALERMGVRHINLVVPWMGYSLQDKVFREGEPIAAKVIANLISGAHIKRVFLLDLHNSSIPGFFSIPTQHLSALDLYVEYAKKNFDLKNFVIASPDFGGLKRSRLFANKLGLELTNIDKYRDLHTGEAEAMGLHGEVKGKSVLVFDDIINGGSTVITATDILKKQGAKEVHFCATHGIFANNGHQRVQDSAVDSVVVTNSIQQNTTCSKIKVIDTSNIFAEALEAWM
jgi:ribose-phosphate pyrophosphokinase